MISIITINYNGWQDTCELIDSLKRYETYPSYEVIVVDNASRGDDVARLRSAHPDVLVVESGKNLGFAGGNNLGYRYANGRFLFFLNNDMVIKAPILAPLVRRLEEGYAGVSPCIQFLYKPDRIQYYGYRELSPITLKHTTESFDVSRREDFLHPSETEVLHGGAMMVSRDVIERVGTMTEVYFLFFEEFDWSRHIRQSGYRLCYEPASVVFHKESMSVKPQTSVREYYLTRARMIYARRNCRGTGKLLACLYQLLLAVPKRIVVCLGNKRFDLAAAAWRGVVSGLFLPLKGR